MSYTDRDRYGRYKYSKRQGPGPALIGDSVVNRQDQGLGASIGLVEITKESKSDTDLMMKADQACYMAKERGRNRVHLYEESSIALAGRRGEMQRLARLHEAFEHDRFRLFALPIANINPP